MIFFILCILFTVHSTYSTPQITVYGDVFQNKDFFVRTLPWIVDNVGGELSIEFYMLGSGRHTVPQMCALQQLRYNTFLQTQFLKCEAEGHTSEFCLCEAGIDAQHFKDCVRNSGTLVSEANAQYTRLNLDALPLIELGFRSTIFEVDDSWYLKKICSLFMDDMPMQPLGCVKPFSCNATESWNSRPGIAQIDKECGSLDRLLPEMSTTAVLPTESYWDPK